MKKVITNARHGVKTTLLGVILILASMAYLFVPMYYEANHPEFHYAVNLWILGTGMLLGVGFIVMPDTVIGLIGNYLKKKSTIILVLILPGMVSCVSYSRCIDKYGQMAEDTVYVHHVDTLVQPVEYVVPGDSLFTSIQLDSLLSARTEDTIVLRSANGRATVQFWKDKYNNFLNAKFSIPPDTVHDTVRVPIEIRIPCPPVIKLEDKPSWFERKIIQWINPWYVLLAIAGFTAWLIVKFVK